MAIASTNPATGELLQSFDALTEAQIDEKLATATAEASVLPISRVASLPSASASASRMSAALRSQSARSANVVVR